MRALTPQEINDAPDWAVKYDVLESADDLIGYYGKGKALFVWSKSGVKSGVHNSYIEPAYAQPIPRKEFDINSYTFSNESCLGMDSDGSLLFDGSHYGEDTCFDRDDIIAMAKLFKITAEDLK